MIPVVIHSEYRIVFYPSLTGVQVVHQEDDGGKGECRANDIPVDDRIAIHSFPLHPSSPLSQFGAKN